MRDYYQFAEEEAEAARARELEIEKEVPDRIKKGEAKAEIARQEQAARNKVAAKKSMEKKIRDLESGIRTAKVRIQEELAKAADYRRRHAEAIARGGISKYLGNAKKAEAAARKLQTTVAQTQSQILDLRARYRNLK